MKEEIQEKPKTSLVIEAKTFRLKACKNNNTLSIVLDDLDEYVNYSKDFSDQCVWRQGS